MWVRHDALLQVADLGLATVADKASSAISQTSTKAGTDHYFSPQKMLVNKHSESKADMWAIGCVLVELLRGKRLEAPLWKGHEGAEEGQAHKELLQEVAGMSPLLGQAAWTLLAWDEGSRINAVSLDSGMSVRSLISFVNNIEELLCAGGVETVVAAMRAHASSAGVQQQACGALRNLSAGNAENKTVIGNAGGVEAVVAAMRAHASSAGVQEQARGALRILKE